MKIIIYNITFCLILGFTSCIDSAVYSEELISGYELSAMDFISDMSIYGLDSPYVVGVVSETVYSVGFDEEFIIAKQHPFENNIINKSITFYYIIPIKDKVNTSVELNKIGPILSLEGFIEKRREYGVTESLDFTITIDELE